MTERILEQPDPQLNEVIGRVGTLYLRATTLAEEIEQPLEDERWDQTAAAFPEYKDRVGGLRELLRAVNTSHEMYEKLYPGQTGRTMYAAMFGIRDDLARQFMISILWGRSIRTDEGWVNATSIESANEAIFQELRGGHYSPDFNLDEALAAVLTGRLGLNRTAAVPNK